MLLDKPVPRDQWVPPDHQGLSDLKVFQVLKENPVLMDFRVQLDHQVLTD